jgi:hypothetical protein
MAKINPFLTICLLALVPPAVRAETIYLKNGMYIVARQVAEKDGRIEYWIAGSKYSLPKSSVEKVEAGNPAIPSASRAPAVENLTQRGASSSPRSREQHNQYQLPLPLGPKQDAPYWSALRNRIVRGDDVDRVRLAEVERENDVRTTTNAYFLAGVMQAQRGNGEGATTYFAKAIKLHPEDSTLLEWHAVALSSQGRYKEAAA